MDVTLKLDRSGRVYLPKRLREALNLKAGDKIQGYLENGCLNLRPEPKMAMLKIEDGFSIIDLPDGVNLTGDIVAEIHKS